MWEIAICNSDTAFVEELSNRLHDFYQKRDLEIRVKPYLTGEAFLNNVNEPVDLLFLDTRLSDISGYVIAELLRNRQDREETFIIFISGHDEDVFEAFCYHPFGYIRKNEYNEVLEKELHRLWKVDHRDRSVWVTWHRKKRLVRIADIMYIENQGHNLTVHCVRNESFRFRKRLAYFDERLKDYYFVRSTTSYLVNCAYVKDIADQVILLDGSEIPCSKARKGQTEKMWQRYIREMTHCL